MNKSRRLPILSVVSRALVVFLSAILILILYGGYLWITPSGDQGTSAGSVRLRITSGAPLASIADSLYAAGLLEERWIFRLGARFGGGDRGIKAGLYEIPTGLSPRDLLEVLIIGSTVPIRVTIPEGSTAFAVARIVASRLNLVAEAFLAVADSVLLAQTEILDDAINTPILFNLPSQPGDHGLLGPGGFHICEGYLFPETYRFAEGLPGEKIAAVLIDQALATIRLLIVEYQGNGIELEPHEIMTLASIVEAETPLDSEKPKVAAVYLNRLRRKMPLEADPTIAYILGKKGQRILYADLESVSPYNTYLHRGLPPGPIGNPGVAAIRSVLQPETDFDALYFVADGRGGHIFSRTFREHQQAVKRFRSLRSRERRSGTTGD